MADIVHSSLTGSDLHECKGADSAAVDTVRVSNGSGSGTWKKIPAASIDATSVKNINKQSFVFVMETPTAPNATIYLPIEQSKTLDSIKITINNTVAGNLTATIKKNGSTVTSGAIASTSEGTSSTISVGSAYLTSDTCSIVFSGTTTSSFSVIVTYSL